MKLLVVQYIWDPDVHELNKFDKVFQTYLTPKLYKFDNIGVCAL